MIDSILLIAAGFAALILAFFAVGALASLFPALAFYTGTLWFSFFRWMLRVLGALFLLGVFLCCIIIAGAL